MRPCSARISAGVAAAARSIIARTAGSSRSIEARSSSESASTCSRSASSISVPSKRSPRLSGAICGCSGSTIVAPSSVSSSSVASTGKVFSLRRSAPPSSGSSGEAKRPARSRRIGSVESSAAASASARPAPSRLERRRVADAQLDGVSPGPARGGGQAHHCAQAVLLEDLRRRLGRELCERARRDGDAALDGLVTGAARLQEAQLAADATHRRRRAPVRAARGSRRRPRSPPRRRAGRRCRTAWASRSWRCRSCTGRARSPPTAACAPASRTARGRHSSAALRLVALEHALDAGVEGVQAVLAPVAREPLDRVLLQCDPAAAGDSGGA